MTALNDAFVNLEKRLDGVLPPVASRAAPGAAPEARPTIPPPSAPPTETGTRILQADTRAADTATVSVPGPVHQRDDQPASLVASNTGTGTTDIPASPPAEQATEVPEPAAPAEPVQQTTPAAGPKTAPTGKNASSGPWVINLISSTDRAYVERFSRERDATRFNAVVNEARVRGRQYWRLQIAGFESAAAARRQAATVKQGLGIKDVWIFRE
jgi:septal ring-binding cell division protein DamX